MSQSRKTKRQRSVAESRKNMFIGNSEELKSYLQQKRKKLEKMAEDTSSKEERERISRYVETITAVLKLKYFRYGKIRSMPELIETVKADRETLKSQLEDYKRQENEKIARLHVQVQQALRAAKGYIANEYEEEYHSIEQEALRDAYEEYQAVKYFYDCEVEEQENAIKVLWWLLGIIHQPVDFFKNAVSEEV